MHILATSSSSLDDLAEPVDLAQARTDIVVASFADSDLAALARAFGDSGGEGVPGGTPSSLPQPNLAPPTLALANLRELKHPMSVDLWVDRLAPQARIVVVRLLGGLDWWRYGVERLAAAARAHGFALAVLPGEDRDDPRLAEASTLPADELAALLGYFRAGGPDNMRALLALLGRHAGRAAEVPPPRPLPLAGFYDWAGAGGLSSQRRSPSPDHLPRGERASPSARPALSPRTDSGCSQVLHSSGPTSDASDVGGEGWGERRARFRDESGPVRVVPPSPEEVNPRSGDEPFAANSRGTPLIAGDTPSRDTDHALDDATPTIPVLFYRSLLMAGDTAPVDALCAALAGRGLDPRPIFVASLKDPHAAGFLRRELPGLRPAALVTLTAFAAAEPGEEGLLDLTDAPVLQAVVATTRRAAWREGARGLASADLAMHVVLPELDGRVLVGAVSFKDMAEAGATHLVNRPEPELVAAVADRVAALVRLRRLAPAARRVAVILPDYAGAAGRTGWAVGLDVPASVLALLADMKAAGYQVADVPEDERALVAALGDAARAEGLGAAAAVAASPVERRDAVRGAMASRSPSTPTQPSSSQGEGFSALEMRRHIAAGEEAFQALEEGSPSFCREDGHPDGGAIATPAAGGRHFGTADDLSLSLSAYRRLIAGLPPEALAAVEAAWGVPEDDPACVDGAFRFRAIRCGHVLVALAPDRGSATERRAQYHDPALPPRHALVAFGLWLRREVDAVVHMGAHGTLEWLPGKQVALTPSCFPSLVVGALPVVYPFIVSNPGEAAQAKRRIAAVTLGHLPPPLKDAELDGDARDLERLVDEYAQAEGLDRRRREKLARLIVEEAGRTGLAKDARIDGADDGEALRRIDAWLCDLKELRLKDGFHVYGRGPCGEAERDGLLVALDGRRVKAGPAGAPARGRSDVLPTGRNLSTADPRGLPTPTAMDLGRLAADEVVRAYMQAHGDWPRALVLDLWGSATLRTGGEEIAQGLALIGARPVWDPATGRVTGIEVLPPAAMGRPRIDVTFRISGLFRDLFPAQIALLDAALKAVARRDEPAEENPLAAAGEGAPRIFGTAPGAYGAGLDMLTGERETDAVGAAYLASASHAYGGAEGTARPAAAAFAARVAAADLIVHGQDDPGRDLLEGDADLAFLGGFAAAAASLGRVPDLVVLDTNDPARPTARPLDQALARIVRRRVAPAYIEGLLRHGPRGAAEIVETVDRLVGFAEVTPAVPSHLIELIHVAYVADERVRDFLAAQSPEGARFVAERLDGARRRGLWHPRRNDVDAGLDGLRVPGRGGEAAE
ncbi:cobaltochelatase subunit CobN [Ancylobacter sp. Lp-2]|uniref:cobaltochelatase subunit CobN n=1 Tax=Ancylobacter sp. Lp-2 TaxID=2881339 RepID=UPI001E53FFE4|nr:cobaltochelatase subunit CobN [Ancylobacter sp. Lp-2]MCB4769509.1 cobaltochelatase subunit CobN [Ancylobacter sp. Lp-2]